MDLLDIIVELSGLPKNDVIEEFISRAERLGIDPENLQMEDIREILTQKVNETLNPPSRDFFSYHGWGR